MSDESMDLLVIVVYLFEKTWMEVIRKHIDSRGLNEDRFLNINEWGRIISMINLV